MDDLIPITRTERLLDGEDLTPTNREEMFIKRIYDKTQEIPEPVNRKEYFLKKAGEAGGDVTVESLSVTSNGTYTAPSGKAYTPVTVSVQPPANSYQLKSITTPTPLATFEASAMPMPSLKVSVEAKQDLHGYDHPWVGGAGKNKAIINTTNPAVTIIKDNDDNVIGARVIVRPQSTVITVKVGEVSIINGNTYTLSGSPQGYSNDTYRLDVRTHGTTNVYNNWNEYNNPTITATESVLLDIYVRVAVNYSLNNVLFQPQVEIGNQATTFAPYSNICPISGWDEVVVSDVGKNLLPMSVDSIKAANTSGTWSGNDYTYYGMVYTLLTDSSNNVIGIKANGTSTMNYPNLYLPDMPIKAGTYTLSGVPANSDCVIYFNSSAQIFNGETKTFDVESDYTQTNIRLCVANKATANNIIFYPQLELGSTATTYEPYINQTTTISLGQTVYGGEVDVVNGGGKNNLAYVELPSTGWVEETDSPGVFTTYAIKSPNLAYPQLICSHANRATSYNDVLNNEGKIGLSTSRVLWHTAFTTVEELEQYLANNTVQIAYELATPTTFTTQPTPIKSLNGQNNLSVDCGEVIEGEYFKALGGE